MFKAQGMVFHHGKRLSNIGENASRHEFAVETHLLHGQIVQTVSHKRTEQIIELAFQLAGIHHRIVFNMRIENTAVDMPVKLVRIVVAIKDGILRIVFLTRLVVALINHQPAFQAFQRPLNGIDLAILTRIHAQ